MCSKLPENNHRSRQWYAIRTYARKEQLAKINFEHQGFVVYLPLVITTKRHARRTEHVSKAFFPGYLFLHLSPVERQWATIASTRGAMQPVRFGEIHPVVPDWVINDLQARENETGHIPLQTVAKSLFKSGDRVRVMLPAGKQEFDAILMAFKGSDRAIILLEMLKRNLTTVVPTANIIAA